MIRADSLQARTSSRRRREYFCFCRTGLQSGSVVLCPQGRKHQRRSYCSITSKNPSGQFGSMVYQADMYFGKRVDFCENRNGHNHHKFLIILLTTIIMLCLWFNSMPPAERQRDNGVFNVCDCLSACCAHECEICRY